MNDALFSIVEIEVNRHCNRRCSYCPNSISPRKGSLEMDPALFDRLIGQLVDVRFAGRVSFHFYNEPMLHSDLDGVVAKTRARLPEVEIEIFTNGTLLTERKFHALVAAGVDRFIVTRHESEKEFPFDTVYHALNDDDRSRVDYQGYQQIQLTNRGGYLGKLGGEAVPTAPCYIPSFLIVVTADGNVLPCFEDYNEESIMGNMGETGLLEVWHSEKFARFRRELKLGLRSRHRPCANCNRMAVLPLPEGESASAVRARNIRAKSAPGSPAGASGSGANT